MKSALVTFTVCAKAETENAMQNKVRMYLLSIVLVVVWFLIVLEFIGNTQ